MAIATKTQLENLTGTELSDSILDTFLLMAHEEVSARLSVAGLSAPTSNDTLATAELYIATAVMLTRYRIDGTKPSKLNIGDISLSDDIDEASNQLRAAAQSLIESYIRANPDGQKVDVYFRKVN